MREDFLHYLWRQARFDLRRLATTAGEPVTIQHFGTLNHDGGPDFGGARLRIGGLQWAGSVEMHLRSGDWYAHGHDRDAAYDGVVLHVVLEEDRPVYRRDGSRIPCLELRERIPAGIAHRYWRLLHNEYWVPCQNLLPTVPAAVRSVWLQRLVAERLTARGDRFRRRLEAGHRDWEAAFYQTVSRALGGRVNAEPMEMLARSLPLRIVLRHRVSRLQLEALFFGQAGLLPPEGADEADYVKLLRREYCLLRTKYGLQPLPATVWRFLRMRPNNFPTVRIAQLACLLYRSGQLFGKALAAADGRELRNMFDVKLSNYWRNHYRFGAESRRSGDRRLGEAMVRSILINAVAPAYYVYGQLREDDRYRERAVDLLDRLPPERNGIITRWHQLGWTARSAAESQALLELKREYCEPVRCTSCAVGCAVLNRTPPESPASPLVREPAVTYGLVG